MANVKTNNQWRDFVYRADVPAKVLAGQFSHLDIDDSLAPRHEQSIR